MGSFAVTIPLLLWWLIRLAILPYKDISIFSLSLDFVYTYTYTQSHMGIVIVIVIVILFGRVLSSHPGT